MNSPNVGRDADKVQQNEKQTRGSRSHNESWWMLCIVVASSLIAPMCMFMCLLEISVYGAVRVSQMCSFDY